MTRGIKRALRQARANARKDVLPRSTSDSKYARGLAYEGYHGGYIDALNDVELALNGVAPNSRFWRRTTEGEG